LKQIVLGTAGHIDHGKTSLIKAITGINTDRLKEEILRGITIELGFAYLTLPSGRKIGIVDVPGHEKFVKNMVAGATGIDMVALVIAADEGIMPQTREHMEICTLLDVRHGLVVLTKVDLVDEEWLAMVQEEVRTFTRNTFLEKAPLVPFSAVTGQGKEQFVRTVDEIGARITPRTSNNLFRLPIDRVFTMKGFGTVITGTIAAGKVAVGDKVCIYPSQITAKVRGLQVHNFSVEKAEAGQRTAINFQGLEKAAVERGEVVALPDTLMTSYMVDVTFNYLSSNAKPLKNRQRVRFHTGTSEIMGVVALLDRDELMPGEAAMAQIRLDTPVVLVRDDAYVVRSYSPVRTIGGGKIIDPIPPKHKANRPELIEHLRALAQGAPEEIVRRQLEASAFTGCRFGDLLLTTNLPEKQLEQTLQHLMSQQTALQIDKEKRNFIHRAAFDAAIATMKDHLGAYHRDNPLKAGMPKEELKSKLPATIDIKLFTLALNQMVKTKSIAVQEDIVHLAEHRVSLGVDQQTLRTRILEIFHQGDMTPPYFKEIADTLGAPAQQAKQVLDLLVKENQLVKIKEDLYYHHQPLNRIKEQLIDFLIKNGEISTPQFKDMTGASRKFVIALIEYFDNIQLTLRVGDLRKLRKRPAG
jgi:selenocysteine-specific elongation factor